VETPASLGGPRAVAALDSAEVATHVMRDESWRLIGKIHGDFSPTS
jgi:hypothetical protein